LQLTGALFLAAAAGCGDSNPESVVASPSDGAGISAPRLSNGTLFETAASGRVLELSPLDGTVTAFDSNGALLFTYSDTRTPVAASVGPDDTSYILDIGNAEILALGTTGQLLRRITAPELRFARDLAFGNGELYVLDHASGQVNVLSPEGEVRRSLSVAGPQAHLRSLVVDAEGNLRILQSNPVTVLVVDATTGETLRQYGSDLAVSAADLALHADGTTLVIDHLGGQLLAFDSGGVFLGSTPVVGAMGDAAQPLRVAIGSGGQLYLSIREVAS
jgi:outer membrane protein assembly factor BamB